MVEPTSFEKVKQDVEEQLDWTIEEEFNPSDVSMTAETWKDVKGDRLDILVRQQTKIILNEDFAPETVMDHARRRNLDKLEKDTGDIDDFTALRYEKFFPEHLSREEAYNLLEKEVSNDSIEWAESKIYAAIYETIHPLNKEFEGDFTMI